MPLETVEHRRLYRQVADQLRALIDGGEFAPGARLPAERELAETFGISRPTLREALIALEVEGRIRIRIGSGIYVADPQPTSSAAAQMHGLQAEGPFEVLHARELIEATVASETALKATQQDLQDLRRILDAMTVHDQGSADLMRLDREFHVAIAGVLGNSLLARVVGELYDQRINPYFKQLASHFQHCGSWVLAAAEHRQIFDCIASGDATGAGAAMRNHLQAAAERYSRSFEDTAQPNALRAGEPSDATRTDGLAPAPPTSKP